MANSRACFYLDMHVFQLYVGAVQCNYRVRLLHFVDTIVNVLDCGKIVCTAFLDPWKAFDSLYLLLYFTTLVNQVYVVHTQAYFIILFSLLGPEQIKVVSSASCIN